MKRYWIVFGVIVIFAAAGGFMWCYARGVCPSQACIATGNVVATTCLGTALKAGLAAFVAGLSFMWLTSRRR